MVFERFIAKRLFPRDNKASTDPASAPPSGIERGAAGGGRMTKIATTSIALGVLVMVTAVCILRGFQGQIRQKVVGFGSHIVVRSYQTGNSVYGNETAAPIAIDRPEVARLSTAPGVQRLQFFAQKGGMVKNDSQIHGIILKGVDAAYDTGFFAQYLVEGRLPAIEGLPEGVPAGGGCISNDVLISQTIADKLQVGVGDKLRTYFWQDNNYRARAFNVCGIYKTDLTGFDDHFIIGDLRQVQRLNNWESNMVDGYEILVDDFSRLDAIADNLLQLISYDLTLVTIVQQNPALFSWLDLLDSNIILIITIMILVCAVAILSALLIMIFEKTSTIGMFKALGATNGSVRRIFLIKAGGIILRGIIVGDALALLLCGLQYRLRFLQLDSASYSMDFVPVDLNPWIFLFVSLGTLLLCLLALLLPTAYISNIHPAKTIRFE